MLSDLRYAIRSLRQHAGYTTVAVSVLALGIGPTAAILSLANELVFRPIPHVRDPGRLGLVYIAQWMNQGRGMMPWMLFDVNRAEIMAGVPALDGLAGYQGGTPVGVAAQNSLPRQFPASFVEGDFFRLLGVQPVLGRAFGPEDDHPPNGTQVVVISYQLWNSQFNRDPQVLGRTLRVNGEPFTIVGVAPKGFEGIESNAHSDVWLPAATYAAVSHLPPQFRPPPGGFGPFFSFVGRLAPGATFQRADAQLRAAFSRFAAEHPEQREELTRAQPRVFPKLGLLVLTRETTYDMLLLLGGVGAVLLLIACANVANLALFRAAQRRGETAVRRALGGGRVRVARLYLTESVLLGLAGGAIGLLLAVWLTGLFEGLSLGGEGIPRLSLDWRVVALTAGVSLAAGLLFGVAPAFASRRLDLSVALKDAARSGTAARPWLRAGLSAVQLMLSLTLLVAGFLFIGTLRNLYLVDLGFDPARVTVFFVDLSSRGYAGPQAEAYFQNFLRGARQLRGVSVASVSESSPLLGYRHGTEVRRPDEDPQTTHSVSFNAVSAGYLDALAMTMVRGRWFTEEETLREAPRGVHPVVISQALAHQLFGDGNPVGQVVSFAARGREPRSDRMVVGVAHDIRWADPTDEPEPIVYLPLNTAESMASRRAVLLVRSPLPPSQLVPAVRQMAAALDNTVALSEAEPLTTLLGSRLAQQRLFAKVLGLLSALALLLAAAGVYGLVSQTVVERTREFGIRIAVGAERRDVLALVMKRAGWLAAWGILGGLAGAWGIGRVIRSRLYGVQPLDPVVYLLALAALVVATFLASYLPARRGATVDPVAALRHE